MIKKIIMVMSFIGRVMQLLLISFLADLSEIEDLMAYGAEFQILILFMDKLRSYTGQTYC